MQDFIQFKLLRPGSKLPKRSTDGAGGFDFYAPEDGQLEVGEKKLVPTGVAHDMPGLLYVKATLQGALETKIDLPFKMQGVLFDRSGLGHKKGIKLSFASLIDNDYRGEIQLSIENRSGELFSWKQGDRLTQIGYMLMYAGKTSETGLLSNSGRGEGGFGSTGR